MKGRFKRCVFVFLMLAVLSGTGRVYGQCDEHPYTHNIEITNWEPEAFSVRSPDIRINTIPPGGSTDYFDPALTEGVLHGGVNKIYVRFYNRSLSAIPDGAVIVRAFYMEAEPGRTGPAVVTHMEDQENGGVVWLPIGQYTMNLAGSGGTLAAPDGFPTPAETPMPGRFSIDFPLESFGPAPAFFIKVEIQLTSATDECLDNNTAYSYYDQVTGVPGVDVVLLHDCSGSMRGEMPEAQAMAMLFFDLMNPGDRIGVVGFSTRFTDDVRKVFPTSPPDALATVSDSIRAPLYTAVSGMAASGGTPMEKGVERARDILISAYLAGENRHQAIILLTDGMENSGSHLNSSPYTTINSLNNIDDTAERDIYFYPLWFGAMSHWGKDLLEEISLQAERHKVVDQPMTSLDLAKAYYMLRGILTHDDIFDIHRGASNDGYASSIRISAVTKELILSAAWDKIRPNLLDIQVRPPGTAAWSEPGTFPAKTLSGKTYIIYRFANPAPGTWEYRLKPDADGHDYVLAALTDTADVIMQSDLPRNTVAAGQPITLQARLTQQGQPVRGAKVFAEVSIPRKSLGSLLLKVRDKLAGITAPPEPDITRGHAVAKKLPQLLNSDNMIQYVKKNVTLKYKGNGIYSGQIAGTGTETAGTYRMVIHGQNRPGSPLTFARQHEHAAVVGLGPIDREKSITDHMLIPPATLKNRTLDTWRITTTPIDIYDNAASPGYGGDIAFTASAGTWKEGETVDYEDGSYHRHLLLKKGQSAEVNISAFGKKLTVETIGKVRKPWQFSFHPTLVSPLGNFKNTVNSGYGFMLDWGYRFHPNFSLMAFYGYSRFPYKNMLPMTYAPVHNVSLNLRGLLPAGTLNFYAQGGGGMYRISSTWKGGFNLGGGMVFPINSGFELEGGGDYHVINTEEEKTAFFQMHLGFVLRF